MRRSVCFWYRIYGTQVPEFTSQPTVFWYFSGNSMEFQNGAGIPKTVQGYSKATAPCASSKLYNKTCPSPDLETDSNSSVMLFSGKHIHNKNLSPSCLKWPPDQDPCPIPKTQFQFRIENPAQVGPDCRATLLWTSCPSPHQTICSCYIFCSPIDPRPRP